WPKRCGHMEGKQVVPQQEYLDKLKVALDTRQSEQFIVAARTDVRAIEGLDAAIERAQKALELGVDMIFVEEPQTVEELEEVAKQVNASLIANMVPGGKTPILSRDELKKLGYSAVFYPLDALYSLTQAIENAFIDVKEDNTQSIKSRKMDFDKFNKLIGLD